MAVVNADLKIKKRISFENGRMVVFFVRLTGLVEDVACRYSLFVPQTSMAISATAALS